MNFMNRTQRAGGYDFAGAARGFAGVRRRSDLGGHSGPGGGLHHHAQFMNSARERFDAADMLFAMQRG